MTTRKALIADSSDSDSDSDQFRVNEQYAERYNNWRNKEEYQRLKDKYGESVLSEASGVSATDSDSEQDSDPGEQAALLSGEIFDDEFLRVYKALKQNDPIIYDTSVKFMSSDQPVASSSRNKKEDATPQMNLMDYHVKLMEERQGVTEEDGPTSGTENGGYFEELSTIKNELKAALSDDEEDEQLFRPIIKKKPDKGVDAHERKRLDLWNTENEADTFLQQFILNKPFMQDLPHGRPKFPADVTHPSFVNESETEEAQILPVATDAKHRFEEAGGSGIRRYPRTLTSARDLVVREEKAVKRKETRERKKADRSEDLKRFTELRRQEMAAKLSKLRETSGNKRFLDAAADRFAFQSLVDDDQFNPEKHDKDMSKLFDNDYYELNADSEKPEFDFIEGIDDDFEPNDGPGDEEEGSAEDCEQNEVEVADDGDGTGAGKLSRKKKKQRKRRNKKVDLDRMPDYDDVVGGLPVRFKYCRVIPNDFGLTAEEILLSDEKELNAWASLKKAVSFRDEQEEQGDILRYNAKRSDDRHKKKVLKSLFKEALDEPVEKKTKKRKRRGKKEAVCESTADGIDVPTEVEVVSPASEACEREADPAHDAVPDNGPVAEESSEKVKRNRKKRKRVPQKGVDEERLRAYGFSKTDMRKKKLL